MSGDLRFAALPRDARTLPKLPRAFDDALDRGLAELGVAVDPVARAVIEAHVRLLLAWNAAINLTAITDPAAVATRHVVDSLTACPLLGEPGITILDLGSGGGFPGVPLAAALPTARVTLLDSVAKKAAFLAVAVEATDLGSRVTIRAARAESLVGSGGVGHGGVRDGMAEQRRGWDAVVARGVGTLAELVELVLPMLRPGGRLVAWKRGDLEAELAAGARAARALGGGEPAVRPVPAISGLDGHVLVEVAKAAPTPPGYPRDPAVRKRRPW
jgi:16S rRNA (guanine527-N7)-methyltransferase